MSEIYFSSDLHFNHDKDFIYKERGFSSVKEMNEEIIYRFNSIVKDDDTLFLLGDIALGDVDESVDLIQQLKGKKFLIIGNHDTNPRIGMWKAKNLFEDIQFGYRESSGKKIWFFSHYPTLVANSKDNVFNLCGHLHTKDRFVNFSQRCYNVEVDAHDCCPVSFKEIKEDIRNRMED